MNMTTTIRQSIKVLRDALRLIEMRCASTAAAVLFMQTPENTSPIYPEFAEAARIAQTNPQAAAELVKATLQKWEEQ